MAPKDISIEDLDEYAQDKMPDFDQIDPILHTQPEKILTKISSENQIRVVDWKAVRWMVTGPPQRPTTQGGQSVKSRSKKPKMNRANLKVNPRVNTASRAKLRQKLKQKISKVKSKKSFTQRTEEGEIVAKKKNPYDTINQQIAYNPSWTQGKVGGSGFDEKDLAKRPKSRQIGNSVSVKNLMHTQRINLKSQTSKRRIILPQPPLGKTIGHGLISKFDL